MSRFSPPAQLGAPSTRLTGRPSGRKPYFRFTACTRNPGGRKDPWPRFGCARGLLAKIGPDLLVATSEARRVLRRRLPSLIDLTPLLSGVCEYAQPVGAGPIRSPPFMRREVCWPQTRAPCCSPAARPVAPSGRPSPRPLSLKPWFRSGSGTLRRPASASVRTCIQALRVSRPESQETRNSPRLTCKSRADHVGGARMRCNGPTRCRGPRRRRPVCAWTTGRGRGGPCLGVIFMPHR